MHINTPDIRSIEPRRAVEGGRVTLRGSGFMIADAMPDVAVGDQLTRPLFVSSTRLVFAIPADLDGGPTPIRVPGSDGDAVLVSVAAPFAKGLHQVDNPVFDPEGNLFVTYSGSRGQETPVSIFRVTPAGTREPFVSGIVNATSLAVGPDERLYVSSRFEGAVYRVNADGSHEQVASDLGVACGLAFDAEGSLYVGDRSGTIFRVRNGTPAPFASLPPSIAAFHLAISPEQELFVSAPTLGSYDHIYRIDREGTVRSVPIPLGRPQGVAFSPDGMLHVVDALAGASGLYRFQDLDRAPDLIVSGSVLVGVAFGPSGQLVVSSNDTAYKFENGAGDM